MTGALITLAIADCVLAIGFFGIAVGGQGRYSDLSSRWNALAVTLALVGSAGAIVFLIP